MLLRLVGDASVLEVDVGVAPGDALVEPDARGISWPPLVRVRARQTPAQLAMACARATARWLAIRAGETWPPWVEKAVALAIVMPGRRFRAAAAVDSPELLAERFVVDIRAVLERMRQIDIHPRASGEWPALRGVL